jgi:hypothetical protein
MCWVLLARFEQAWRENDIFDSSGLSDPNRLWDGRSFGCKQLILRCQVIVEAGQVLAQVVDVAAQPRL